MDNNLIISNRGKEVVFDTYNRFPVSFESGNGVYLYDSNKKEYLDFVAGIAVNCLGYNNPELSKIIEEQAKKLLHCSNLYWNEPMVDLAEKLVKLSGLDKVFFCNSGAEAIEAALKLARIKGVTTKGENAFEVISMKQSFHGRTFGAISATGQLKYHEGFYPLLPGIKHVNFNDFEELQRTVNHNTCAILIEPIQGEGGIVPADKNYLIQVSKLCSDLGITLIFDEIQCGVGRTGKFFAFEKYGVKPDIVLLAKGLAAGIPIGAMIASDETAQFFKPGKHASTFGGNPFACSVSSYVVDKINQQLEGVFNSGLYLTKQLLGLQEKYPELIKEVRGYGLIQGIELIVPVKNIIDNCMSNGLLLVSAGENIIRFVPPLIVTEKEIEKGINILNDAFLNEFT